MPNEITEAPALVVQTAFLGDVVLSTPLLALMAGRHGPVDVVTTTQAAPLLETHPAVRQVIPFDKRGADRGIGGLGRLARKLRAERYQVAYLPHRSLRSALLARWARIPRRVGYAGGWGWGGRALYTEVVPYPGTGHHIDRLLALAGLAELDHAVPTLALTDADVSEAEAVLRAGAVTPPFVALAPGSIWGSKRWPHYVTLAVRLSQLADVVVVGGADDFGLGEEIVKALRGGEGRWKAVNVCGRLTLRQSAALIRMAAVLATNDSAPLHVAQAVGTPTVAIFGPTIPAFGFGPRGARDVVVEVNGLSCRPCSAHGPPACPLGHHRCMTDLRVEQVLNAIEDTGALHRRT